MKNKKYKPEVYSNILYKTWITIQKHKLDLLWHFAACNTSDIQPQTDYYEIINIFSLELYSTAANKRKLCSMKLQVTSHVSSIFNISFTSSMVFNKILLKLMIRVRRSYLLITSNKLRLSGESRSGLSRRSSISSTSSSSP